MSTKSSVELALYKLAKAKNARVRWWWGRRGGSKRRMYNCYLCGECIDTESASYAMSRHAQEAVDRHFKVHAKDGNKLIESGLIPISAQGMKKLDKYDINAKQLGCRKIVGVLCGPENIVRLLEADLGRHTKAALQRAISDPNYFAALLAADDVGALKVVVAQQEAA